MKPRKSHTLESLSISRFPDMQEDASALPLAAEAVALLASGGDARIALDPEAGLNRYLSAPYPRKTLAYASSTANDLSKVAFAYACQRVADGITSYSDALDALRERIRDAYQLDDSHSVVFAASGTDLEYVALAAVSGRSEGGIHNILLGADEVGSGCPFSASGQYFADLTAVGIRTTKGGAVPGLEQVSLADIPVRCAQGQAYNAAEISAAIEVELGIASSLNQHALVHVVHGSKTGLILPDMAHIDHLKAKWGDEVTFVVDACQARITSQALRDYLDRGAIVFITGSKFMGGAPFNGFALVPPAILHHTLPPSRGLSDIFRMGEWPSRWQGRDILADGDNPGLALRLDAAIFELERFQQLSFAQIERVIVAFEAALENRLLGPLDIMIVKPYAPGDREEAVTHPIEMRTLATLDVSHLPGLRTIEDAQSVHHRMALDGLRLGQPVKCVRLPDGVWGGTLRIGLSMPQMVEFAQLDDGALALRLSADMETIRSALTAATVR